MLLSLAAALCSHHYMLIFSTSELLNLHAVMMRCIFCVLVIKDLASLYEAVTCVL